MNFNHYSINAESLSKKFNRHFLFRDFSFQFTYGKSYALTGPNGSGKSTLLQILAGIQLPTSGKVMHSSLDQFIEDKVYKYVSLAGPYTEVIEEFTLNELIAFHSELKPFVSGFNIAEVLESIGLAAHQNKEVRLYSSGMKQRVKLLLSMFSDAPVLLLDEPTTNLDDSGIDWYRAMIDKVKKEKLLIVASNQRVEYDFCDEVVDLKKFI